MSSKKVRKLSGRLKPAYVRMLERMEEMAAAKASKAERDWCVYILRCGDGSFYTGIAKDVSARIAKHNLGRGAAYTRSRRPVALLVSCDGLTRVEALMKEARVKALSRPAKEKLIARGASALADFV